MSLGFLVLAVAGLPSALLIVDRPETIGLRPDNLPDGVLNMGLNQMKKSYGEIDWTPMQAMRTRPCGY
ncbi:MAG: hypothetical protein CM1200mP27_00590 [Chloroflexota bacterium]|nr:MAG: hypothetical protein CM1200mP27_00590 [Chloroflexota bacterium]